MFAFMLRRLLCEGGTLLPDIGRVAISLLWVVVYPTLVGSESSRLRPQRRREASRLAARRRLGALDTRSVPVMRRTVVAKRLAVLKPHARGAGGTGGVGA